MHIIDLAISATIPFLEFNTYFWQAKQVPWDFML